MAKGSKGQHGRHFRQTPYPLPSCNPDISENLQRKNPSIGTDKKEFEDITCSVCMECPHNAVLLLCSSHDKGCRPYMCGTSFRYSNCLDQYEKAYANASLPADNPGSELACPLCRGQVKGWTVVDPAREYLNSKKRSCMQDDCSFVGTFRELRKHMRAAHPSARPREVDPVLEQKWRRLERECEHNDVMSTIRSTMPGAMVFGDYVIERNSDVDSDEENGDLEGNAGFDRNLVNMFLLLHAFGHSRDGHASVDGLSSSGDENSENDNRDGSVSFVSRLRHHDGVLSGRSRRRHRDRDQASRGPR